MNKNKDMLKTLDKNLIKLARLEARELRRQMLKLKAEGKDYSHLATCPDTYVIYKSVLFA